MKRNACLVCGKPLIYFETAREMECVFCHKKFPSNASCEDGHFVCDECHAAKGLAAIRWTCLHSTKTDPVALAQEIMANPYVYMHGPEHHVLVGAALLTAYRNAGGQLDWPAALYEMESRGRQVPGGACGFWGCCGAAVSAGMFVSIATGATPLEKESWALSNRMTSLVLEQLSRLGGPRCCKRNSFTAMILAVRFAQEHLGVTMDLARPVRCDFSGENQQCLGRKCPYNRIHDREGKPLE